MATERWMSGEVTNRGAVAAFLLLLTIYLVTVQQFQPLVSGTALAEVILSVLLPCWLHPRLGEPVAQLTVMVCGALLGWLVGLRIELGDYALLVLESWCANASVPLLPWVWGKVAALPLSYAGMVLGGLLAMLSGPRSASTLGFRGCCALTLLLMASAVLLALSLLWFNAGPGGNALPMFETMVLCMCLVGAPAVLLTRRPVGSLAVEA